MPDNNVHTAMFVYEGAQPDASVLIEIITKAGYTTYEQVQLLIWRIFTSDGSTVVEQKLRAVIGSGYRYASQMGDGSIVGVDVDQSAH